MLIEPELNDAQYEAYNSEAQQTFLIGGVGMGKSYFLGLASLRALATPGAIIGIYSPTVKMLRNSTLKQIKDAWNSMGFLAERDYVIGKKPYRHWNVQMLSGLHGGKILTTRWGSYAYLDGLDNFDSQRGIACDEIFVDEFREVDEEARDILLGRLRGNTYTKLKKKRQIWFATTPPNNVSYLKELNESNNPDIRFVFGSSYLNQHHVSREYIDSMKASYDDITFRREVLGELVQNSSKLFCYAFNYDKHVSSKVQTFPGMTAYLSFDFNIDPLTCVVFQQYQNKITVIKEFVMRGADIYKFCQMLKPYVKQFARVKITGDASGNSSSALSQSNKTYYDVIRAELQLTPHAFVVSKTNLQHKDSSILVNSVLARHKDLKIHESCKGLIKDLQNVTVTDDGKIDKSNRDLTHLLDCFRYYIHAFHPDFITKHK